MAKKKNVDPNKTPPKKGDNFDDLEDAFFATGDASGFWEKADASQLDDDSEEVDDITDIRNIADPLDEPSESISAGAMAPDTGGSKPQEALRPPTITVPNDVPLTQDPSGEFYNPSGLHPSPDLIADEETEVWSEPESAEGLLNAPTVIYEPDDEEDPATVPAIEDEGEGEAEPPSAEPVGNIRYTLPDTREGRWGEAALALERAATQADGKEKAALLRDSARILLTRVGSWEAAGKLFDAAIKAGLAPMDAPKGYADVIASQGRFAELRDLLIARATSQSGAASIEAFQDAAIVERNHLKDDQQAIQTLHSALDIQDDWFTLRLLRELYYRTRNWTVLVYILDRMAGLSGGALSARCKVEEGRIREGELSDLEGAEEAYQNALKQDPTYMDALLACLRVSTSRKDYTSLASLYAQEASRTDGSNRAFWAGRAARIARDGGLEQTG